MLSSMRIKLSTTLVTIAYAIACSSAQAELVSTPFGYGQSSEAVK